jgi:hypothetical protein
MKYRKLRIAFSITCGIACLLFVALWVRSYWWMDSIPLLGKYSLTSFRGDILCNKPWAITYSGPTPFQFPPRRYGVSTIPSAQPGLIIMEGGHALPYWVSIVLAVALGITAWLPHRFNLRTLLIATTVVAVVLGVVVAVAG